MTEATLTAPVKYRGALSDLSGADRRSLFERARGGDTVVHERTAAILRRVRADGDLALLEMASEYDGVTLEALEVPADVRRRALASIDPRVRRALEHAARNITAFHDASRPQAVEIETEPGVVVGRRPDALARVGIYAPGGRAPYASSVLMAAVPARVAGVPEIILCSPAGKDGYPAAVVLAACEIGGVDRVFAVGGAGAIAAMAYGTECIPGVDKIVGPGNAYVAEAKLLVSSVVGIDSPAGPSELMVICDSSCDPDTIAREVLAQAEHDVDACVVVLALDSATASVVASTIERTISRMLRAGVILSALQQNGAILTAASIVEAVQFASEYSPEHLLLAVADPDRLLPEIRNAGCVFVGEQSSVVFGDYITGGNHVLPTGGAARRYSGLGSPDFVRWTSYQKVSGPAAKRLARDTVILAEAEGLQCHAAAASAWSSP
ncbi:MAG: histidinol dehydrogenase [Gemmatimonadaceae bacterium]